MPVSFFGWFHKGHKINPDIVERAHTGHAKNTFISGQNHFLLNSDAALYHDDNITISYSGNFRWLDHISQSIADTQGHGQAIHSAFIQKGSQFLTSLSGPFAISIINNHTGYILLAIDRMGIERMVYSNLNGFAFSNCLKTLTNYSGLNPDIAPQSIYNYVYFHMIPSPDTIYQGIYKIEPGHYVEFSKGDIHTSTYWKTCFTKNNHDSERQHSSRLHSILEGATTHLTNRHTGAFLSGGLDSSSVSGFLSKAQPRPKTFSIGFDADGYDETEYARVAAKHFGTDHHEYYVTPEDVLDIVPKIARAYDEPFGNSSAIPVYYCAKLAQENGCSTLLAGDGGDELFGGNERYVKQKLFETYRQSPKWFQSLNRSIFGSPLGRINGFNKANSFLRQAHTPLPERMENYNFLHQIAPSEVFSQALLETVNPEQPIEHLRHRFLEPEQADYLDRMLYLDWKRTLADNDLRKVNEMCALAGIKVRYPMLDDELVDFSCSIPSGWKMKGMRIRHFYKQAMKGFLPDQVLNKSKHGFGLPFGVWMRTHPELQEMAYDAVSGLKTSSYFAPDFLDQAISMHKSGHASYYGELIWILMMLQLWLESHQKLTPKNQSH